MSAFDSNRFSMNLKFARLPKSVSAPKPPRQWHYGSLILAVSTFGLGLISTALLVFFERQLIYKTEEQLAIESIGQVRSAIEESFYRRFSLVPALESLVLSNGENQRQDTEVDNALQDSFDRFTTSLQQEVSGILSLQLAPQGVVTYISNYERNAEAAGHDLLVDDNRRDQVLRTIQERSVIVAGPVELVQGGEAIIARKAIFLDGQSIFDHNRLYADQRIETGAAWPDTIPPDFWGFATALIATDDLYAEAGLNQLPDKYRYAMRGRHGLGAAGEVFWGEADVFDQPLVTVPINLPNGEWLIAIQLNDGLNYGRSWGIGIVGIGISLAIAILIYRNAESLHKYQQSVTALATERELNELKSRFITTTSHEFRTPLGIISSSAGILENYGERIDAAKQRKHFQRIQNAVSHMTRLIEDVLSLGQIEANELQIKPSPLALRELCQEIIEAIHLSYPDNPIQFKTPTPLPELILADKQFLTQILSNLLSNALKYSTPGVPVTLQVQWRHRLLTLTVHDQGIGIPPEAIPHLFQPFHRAKNAENIVGTGLGLSIVKSLVERYQGTIACDSQVGQGTTFTVTLPVDRG